MAPGHLRHRVPNFVVPLDNVMEAAVVAGVRVFGVRHLADVVALLNEPDGFPAARFSRQTAAQADPAVPDFRDVRGQATAKRALEVAAAGGHNLTFDILAVASPDPGADLTVVIQM